MGFIRSFNEKQIQKMQSGENAELFEKLKTDVLNGTVFPAVRKNELYFYYKGGCLYKFSGGSFKRDKNYEKYGTEKQDGYSRAKTEIEVKFTNVGGGEKERRLLDGLNRTFDKAYKGNVVTLDIEVNLNGTIGKGKKCDLVLLNRKESEIMFVEGKVFSDRRINVAQPLVPEVISQVNTYTAAIAEQRSIIIEQYTKHIEIINELFGTSFDPLRKIIEPAKLLVYATPLNPTPNGEYSINKIKAELGAANVLWVEKDYSPSLDEIWQALTQ